MQAACRHVTPTGRRICAQVGAYKPGTGRQQVARLSEQAASASGTSTANQTTQKMGSSNVLVTDESFLNARGQRLAVKRYTPVDQPIRALISVHHGLGDYTSRHLEGHSHFCDRGYVVYAFDAHGHGDSEPALRCAVSRFGDLVQDAEQFNTEIVGPYRQATCPDVPLFLLGPSMGALVSFYVAARGKVQGVTGLIISAAAMNAKRSLLMNTLQPFSTLLNYLAPNAAIVPALDPGIMARDPAVIAEIAMDDKLWKGSLRVCTACSMLEGFEGVKALWPRMQLPLLALHGDEDAVCPVEYVREMLDNVPSQDTTLKEFPKALHDLEHDYVKVEWREVVTAWIEERL